MKRRPRSEISGAGTFSTGSAVEKASQTMSGRAMPVFERHDDDESIKYRPSSSRNDIQCHSSGNSSSSKMLSLLLLIICASCVQQTSASNEKNKDDSIRLHKRHDKKKQLEREAAAFGGYGTQTSTLDGSSPPSPSHLDTSLFCTSMRHVHLAVGHDPTTSMTVSFSSGPCDIVDPDTGQRDPPARAGVMIGTSPTKLDRLVLEKSTHDSPRWYNATQFNEGRIRKTRELYVSEYQRHVRITGLRPDTAYYYRCVTLREGGGALAKGPRTAVREDEDEDMKELALIRDQEKEEEFRDGEEDDQRRRTMRGTPDLAPPPAYELHYYSNAINISNNDINVNANANAHRKLHANPQQIEQYVEDQIALAKHKIETGAMEPDAHPCFHTAPVTTAESSLKPTPSPVKFAIIGDVAQTKPALDTLSHLNDNCEDITATLLVGDISYSNGVHNLWDSWFDMVDMYGHVFHHKPLMVATGNHEAERDTQNSRIFVSYEARFRMPQVKSMTGGIYEHAVSKISVPYPLPYDYGNAFYSFKYGPTHNIVLNSFGEFKPKSVQYKWFVHELKNVDRKVTPWLTVTIHCPLYNTFAWHRRDKQSVLARRYLEKVFYKYNVNFVLSGHLHAYMRTKPVYNDRPDKKGPMHIVLGNGGRQTTAPYFHEEPEEWLAIRDHTTYGYGTLEFVNNTHARYEWVQTDANDVPTNEVKVSRNANGVPLKAKDQGITDKVFIKNQLYL